MFDELKEVKYFREVTDSYNSYRVLNVKCFKVKKLNVQRVFKKQRRI